MADIKVTVLEYGYGENVPLAFYLGDFADPEAVCPVHPFTLTLLQGGGKNILIDTGIDPDDPVKQDILKRAAIGHLQSPKAVLGSVGVTPEEVDAVILTHAHFDHAGAIDCYPNARFYIQKREYLGWIESVSDERLKAISSAGIDPSDVQRLRKLESAGRLELIDGDKPDLFPGISVIAAGFGHSFGSQIVLIETGEGLLIHTGDTANRPENLLGTEDCPFYIPNTKFATGSAYYMIKDYDRIMQWAGGKIDRVIMTHDGTRRERFPDSIGPLGLGIYRY